MSNKSFDKLNVLEQMIRKRFPVGAETGTKLVIRLVCGFELFNTRPYHNYETWSQGWEIEGYGVRNTAEDLDDCIKGFIEVLDKVEAGATFGPATLRGEVSPHHKSDMPPPRKD